MAMFHVTIYPTGRNFYGLTNTRQIYDALDASYLTHYKPVNNLGNDEQRVDPKS